MNRGELRARVRFFIDEPQQQNFTDADINIAINIAQLQVQLEINQANEDYFINPVPTSITLAGGTSTYALGSDVLSINRVEDATTGLEILPLDLNEKQPDGSGSASLVSQAPSNWYFVGSSIGFSPMPTTGGKVNFWFVPVLPDLIDDTATSQIPKPYHDMIAVRAAIDSFIKDEADISNMSRMWVEYVDRLKRTVKNRQSQAPKRVRRVRR